MRRSVTSVVFVLTVFSGFATQAATPGDPWERLNRKGYAINHVIDTLVVRPLALFTRGLTPGPLGRAVHHALVNLSEPVVIINDILQLRFKRAAASTGRFALNSTVGLAGMVDVANRAHLPHHDNTFGDTLGRYGVKSGPYLYLPLVGPSTVRDLFGAGIDSVSNPIFFLQFPYSNTATLGVGLLTGLDARAEAEPDLKTLLDGAADPYATLRSTYLQSRQGDIDQASKPLVLPDFDDPASKAPVQPRVPDSAPIAPAAAETPATHDPAPLDKLPDEQGGGTDDKVTGTLDQGKCQS